MTRTFGYRTLDQTPYDASEKAEPKNAPELPIGRFLNSKSLGGNRVILVVLAKTLHDLWQKGNRGTHNT